MQGAEVEQLGALRRSHVVSKGDFRGIEQDRFEEETGIWERI